VDLFPEFQQLWGQLFHKSLKETTMRVTKLLLICICCFLAVSTVWGQSANSQAKPGILGYLDPHTGAFRPIAPPVDEAAAVEPPAPTVFGGTINITITITVKSAGMTNVICTAGTSVIDGPITASPRIIDESNTVAATGTGATRTCKLSIPYSWGLLSQATDMMNTSYTVGGATSTTGTPPVRSSGLSPLDTRKVPANGTITTLTAAVTI
jgi:hypothetical protein